mmetsp:Transcript_87018/g.251336  ORF Transcript_87018/g.251336 Transcript_87018/m.251336 type:complete len:281 (+) Transcript_87018:172-1014(+)
MSNDDESGRKKELSSPIRSPLSDDERVWVIQLQDELRRAPNKVGKTLSDWDIACHAVIAKSRPSKALHRIRRLQQFRQSYKVPQHPTVYEAIKVLHDFVDAYPSFIQAVGQDSSGRWVISYELKKFVDAEKDESTLERDFTALYFLMMALQPDLDSVRKGTVWIGDLTDITRQDLPLTIINGARSLCRDSFPIKLQDVPCLNAPSKFSAVYALCRPFFSPKFTEKLVWDCPPLVLRRAYPKRFLGKQLGGTQSRHQMLDLLEENLTRRFAIQESFRLNLI